MHDQRLLPHIALQKLSMFASLKRWTVVGSQQKHLSLFHTTFRFHSLIHHTLHRHLEQCSSNAQLKVLHAQIIVHGLARENFILGKLISFAAINTNGDLEYALRVFNQIAEPNKYMFNSLIRGFSDSDKDPSKAIVLYRRMVGSGLSPNEFTLPFVLKACANESLYWVSVLVHCQAIKLGIGFQVVVQNALLNVYLAFEVIEDARKLFDEMTDRTLVSWNTIISGYSKIGRCEEAFRLFCRMRESQVVPDEFTMVSLLSACSQTRDLDSGRFVHLYIEVTGVEIDLIVSNALLDMYGKCGDLHSAETIFHRMPNKNVVSWTAMVSAYAKHGFAESAQQTFDRMPLKNVISWNSMISASLRNNQCREALCLFDRMIDSGTVPDETTLVTVLSACGNIGDAATGKKIQDYICSKKIILNISLYNSLMAMYAKCGEQRTALFLFREMPQKNLVSWNIAIGALALHGSGLESIKLFEEMEGMGILPDPITFTGLLSACSHGGLIDLGLRYFHRMQKVYSIEPEIEHYGCMMDLLGRGGFLEEAIKLIARMPMRPDIVTWGALLGACKIHGFVDIGKVVLKQLLELLPHSAGLCVLLTNLYSEAERWEDMWKIRKIMSDNGASKCDAVSFIEIDGSMYQFMVDDRRSELSSSMYSTLDQLTYLSGGFLDGDESPIPLVVHSSRSYL